jgi:hypothetical protein
MSNLNSTLLEGTVYGDPVMTGEGDGTYCSFTVLSLRFLNHGTRKAPRMVRHETRVRVTVRGVKFAEVSAENAQDGRRVRVVGWLAEDNDGLYIEAEHVEYRHGYGEALR